MPTKAHQFIADSISLHLYSLGYEVVGYEGISSINKYKLKLPPKILRHRPDIIGVKSKSVAIGEAKTADDVSRRTKEQLQDFTNSQNWIKGINYLVIFAYPSSFDKYFNNLIKKLGISTLNLKTLPIPDRLIPDD